MNNPQNLQNNVNFINDYDAFKTMNMLTQDNVINDILEDCKCRIANLCTNFVDLITEDAQMGSYSSAIKLKNGSKSVTTNTPKIMAISTERKVSPND